MDLPPLPPPPTSPPDPGVPSDRVDVSAAATALDECAELVNTQDRLSACLVAGLIELRDARIVRDHVGVSDESWLGTVADLPEADARRIVRHAKQLSRLPHLLSCMSRGRLRYATAVRVAAEIGRARAEHRESLDEAVGLLMASQPGPSADELIDAVSRKVDEISPSRLEREEAAAARDEFVAITPFAFGGGSIYAELGPENFAAFTEAVDAPLLAPTLDQAKLEVLTDEELANTFDEIDRCRRQLFRSHGKAMAAQLAEVCHSWLAGDREAGRRSRPSVLLTISAETLLGDNDISGHLLHTLTGGLMRTSASFQRDLVDRYGADIRTVVLDDANDVVGVGRKARIAPQWLREAIWVRDLVDRSPEGRTAVRRCDIDHIEPWHPPPGADRPPGRTDANNLQPIGRRGHSDKTSNRWAVERAADGTTTWTNRKTGWTVTRGPTRGPTLPVKALTLT